ncbi:hypothetical protein L596_028908 [Steinernema carpocapsae]|uniref:Uncharacterized protein n=1 Tax=Steinernema carpocapsae TaxID=34508 RepID=A0A4U5LZR5_STECR|nr:hypothetical protein L596_028908 [Steinernema carpocapsae]
MGFRSPSNLLRKVAEDSILLSQILAVLLSPSATAFLAKNFWLTLVEGGGERVAGLATPRPVSRDAHCALIDAILFYRSYGSSNFVSILEIDVFLAQRLSFAFRPKIDEFL